MDEPGTQALPAVALRRESRSNPQVRRDAPVVRPAAIGTGPRLLPRRARQDWAAAAAALPGARPLAADARFSAQACLARLTPPQGAEWLHEIKWDGHRLLVELREGNARLRSRNGQDWTARFPELVRAIEGLGVAQAWIDGEVVALDRQGRSDFAALKRKLDARDTADLRLLAFDLPALAGIDLRSAPLIERKRLLERLLASQAATALAYSRHIVGHGERVFARSRVQGVEGIVSKRLDSGYGGRGAWTRARHEEGGEFVLVGYRRAGAGIASVWLGRREDGQWRLAGRARAGAMEAGLLARLRAREQAEPSVVLPAPERNVRWLRPELVAEVDFRGWDGHGQVRDARLRRVREDKDAREIAPEAGMRTAITHPERIVYADAGITKGEVADYYRAVAPWMLGELVRRPLSLVRCPAGSDAGSCFFQKHHSDSFGEAVKSICLQQKDGKREYLYVEDADGLLALVQFNGLEFHPWGARVDQPERPDRLVFDLDPDGAVAWKQVVAAAREVRARLREQGLESFVRQTGGKGLHVVAPIRRGPDWQQAKEFCQAIAEAMVAAHPERYVATMSKAKREGRIFIDWLRNSRGATSVTSWSLRARPGAPVAMPLRWDELGKLAGPGAFDLRRALRRASALRSDPWDGIDALEQALPG